MDTYTITLKLFVTLIILIGSSTLMIVTSAVASQQPIQAPSNNGLRLFCIKENRNNLYNQTIYN